MLLELSVGFSYHGTDSSANRSANDAAESCTNNAAEFGTISIAVDYLQ
jgi:hypothetical protein